jgi:DNA-binding transcriptional LysR family regulator
VGEDLLVPLCQPDDTGAPRWTLDSPEVPYLAYSSESGLGGILKADWEARSLAPRLEMVLQSRLAAALLSMAIDGRGVAWAPLSLAQSALGSGKVVLAAGYIVVEGIRGAVGISLRTCRFEGGLHRPPLPHHP